MSDCEIGRGPLGASLILGYLAVAGCAPAAAPIDGSSPDPAAAMDAGAVFRCQSWRLESGVIVNCDAVLEAATCNSSNADLEDCARCDPSYGQSLTCQDAGTVVLLTDAGARTTPDAGVAPPSTDDAGTDFGPDGGLPAAWTCNPSFYGDNEFCDCGCGQQDPDCGDLAAETCDQCHCGTGQHPCVVGEVMHDDNGTCAEAVSGWDYDRCPFYYGANDGCDCGCGVMDSDCPQEATLESCDNNNCPSWLQPDPDNIGACVDPGGCYQAAETCGGCLGNSEDGCFWCGDGSGSCRHEDVEGTCSSEKVSTPDECSP